MQKTQNFLKSSLIYRFFAVIYRFFSAQWSSSGLISRFLHTSGGTSAASGASASGTASPESRRGIVTSIPHALRRAEIRVFHRLRLDKALRGSIFTRPELWCALVVILAPIIPTMMSAALAGAALFACFMTLGAKPERRIAGHSADKYILLFIFVYIVAIFTSVTVSGSAKGGAMLAFFALFAIVTRQSIATRRDAVLVIRALVVGGCIVACYGVLQYVRGTNNASAWVDSEMFQGMTRVYSTLQNPNVLSEYLLLVIPFAAACLITAKLWLARLFFLGTLSACLLCMVLTFARGGWIGLVVAAAIFLVMIDRRFILLGIIALVAMYFLLPDVIMARLMSVGNLKDGSTSYRMYIWLGTLAMLRDFWFVGIGPGEAAFNRIYPRYGYNAIAAPHSHNLFLQFACDAGVLAPILFICMMFSYVRSLATSIVRDKATEAGKALRYYRIAAIASLAGFIVQSMTDYSFYNYRVALIFWGVTGLGLALASVNSEQITDNSWGRGTTGDEDGGEYEA